MTANQTGDSDCVHDECGARLDEDGDQRRAGGAGSTQGGRQAASSRRGAVQTLGSLCAIDTQRGKVSVGFTHATRKARFRAGPSCCLRMRASTDSCARLARASTVARVRAHAAAISCRNSSSVPQALVEAIATSRCGYHRITHELLRFLSHIASCIHH